MLLSLAASPSFSQTTQPLITSIRPEGTNVVVVVNVPSGIRRVTLESRARFGDGAWSPAAVSQTDGNARTMTFRIPCTRQSELLRVRADKSQPLPASFYGGTNAFLGPPTNSLPVGIDMRGGVGPTDGGPSGSFGDSTRAVVESDIWQLSGDTLFFFNQYRGLQVIDISNPDAASVRGTLELPAAGEQMYLTDSNRVVLLVRNDCSFNTDGGQIVLVAVSNGLPQIITNLPLPGWIQESRMVGTALYVASQTYRPVAGTTNSTWEWGTVVSAFDLAKPEQPVTRNTLWYPGYGNVVSATDTYLFVVTQDPTNWWQSIIRIVDITAPDGSMSPYASLRTAGRVNDKFKLNYADGIFTSISEDWHGNSGRTLVTRLETFRLPDPRSGGPGGIVKLGQLELGNGEQLHATRFDSNRVYVVTFFRIDPLWVVDLSDPARPRIAGAVDVPGWSTYILPLGNRLVSVGVESNRVAVSLFDVHDANKPTLLSRVRLGQNYSWSEANNDEKAFAVLTDQNLIMVPYNGDTTNGWTLQVQLIDLNPTSLVARGIIQHQCQPRRATFSHNRILSLSGWELLSVEATDRDHPVLRGNTELAWSVDRVFLHENYLLEIAASSGWWGYQGQASVRVAPSHQPDQTLGKLSLNTLPVVGVDVKDGRLYVAQSQTYYYPPMGNGDPSTNPPNFVLTVLDLRNLPELAILGQVSVSVDLAGWGGSRQPVWPKSDVLVWVGSYFNYWWGPWDGPLRGGGIGITDRFVSSPFWGSGGGQLLAFDVGRSDEPKFTSELNLGTNNSWGFSQPLSSGSLVYLSHNATECLGSPTNPASIWIQRSFLDVIDYADPASPTMRKPANIPGTLLGLAQSGELLYTTGYHWTNNQSTDWREWLDASAYDGVNVHLVDSLLLPEVWPRPVLPIGTNLYIGRPGYNYTNTDVVAHRLETWTLPDTGKFKLLGTTRLDSPANTLIERNSLLAAQEAEGSVDLFDPSTPGSPALIGHGRPQGCLWFDLTYADGSVTDGLWLPLGMYGVAEVQLGP